MINTTKNMDQTNQQNSNQQPISRLVLENNVPCFINEGGNLILVLPNGDKINPLFTDKIYWLKRVAYAVGISPLKVEKLIEKQRSGFGRPKESRERSERRRGEKEAIEPQEEVKRERVDIFQKLEEA